MTTNPFASPADAAEPAAGNPLKPVAITLIAMSVVWMLVCAFFVVDLQYSAANPKDPGMVRVLQLSSGTMLICSLFQIVLIWGAINMLRTRSYLWSCVTCWLASIPVLGPCYLLSIPVGIWGMFVLGRPATRKLFPPTPPGREPVLGVAVALITLAIVGMAFALFGVNYFVSTTLTDEGWQVIWIPLAILAASFLYQIGLLYGAVQMIGTGSYRAATITCGLACVPILGPCYFFAIPVGIWGSSILWRPDVVAGWDSTNSADTSPSP